MDLPEKPPRAQPAAKQPWLRTLVGLALAGATGTALAALAAGPSPAAAPKAEAPAASLPPAGPAPTASPARRADPEGESLEAILGSALLDSRQQRYVTVGADGSRTPLTLDPELQRTADRLLQLYRAPLAELVAIDPATGRLLAVARGVGPEPDGQAIAAEATYPAASVFKLVTTAALLDRGVPADEAVCYHGGKHRLRARLLADDARHDRRCVSLAQAVAHSSNVAIAKLAERNLDQVLLRSWASRFLFDAPLPLESEAERSRALVPADPFAFASTAAGFGQVTLSPLHGAAIAAAIANDGTLAPLQIVDGRPTGQPRRILSPKLARELTAMMELAVSEGTAHKAFRSRAARALEAAGKTGSLSAHQPFRDYSWFVGFAPALSPRIAVAALVVNGLKWRVHASTLAEATMQAYLRPPRPQKAQARR